MRYLRMVLPLVLAVSTIPSIAAPTRLSLDDEWLFTADSLKVGLTEEWFRPSFDRSGWLHVQTPQFWEGYPGLAAYDGWGWYARTFELSSTARPLSIHFAGVDDDAEVWVNGKPVGSHTGYSEPFVLDVSAAVHTGQNSIVVLVKDNGGGGGIYKPVTLIESTRLEELLKGPYADRQALRSADWVRDAVIYEVYLRSFSPEGTFQGLEKRIPELKSLGATVLWLMPIHPSGAKNRKGVLGSPYAVRDYYAVNPEFGTLADFKRLLNAAHRSGLKLIIDLVANHTSWDSKLIVDHPEWFTKDSAGAIVGPNADWTDVADLDYSRRALRDYMIAMMCWWVRDVGIDGFRCDVAELVPTDFWDEARTRLNRIKPVMMLSEGSIPGHHLKAFDLSYSWNIYDALLPLLSGQRPVALLDQILTTERLQFPKGALRMRFTTNHDKNAWDKPAVGRYGLDGLKLATVLVNMLPGVPLIYTGEEVANDRRLSLFEKVDVDWSRPRVMEDLYRRLFALRKNHKALSRGDMVRVPADSAGTAFAFFRVAGNDRLLVVLNFDREQQEVTLHLPADRVAPGRQRLALKEVFSGRTVNASADTGWELPLALPGKGYMVFELEGKND
jgi:glycosidase